MTKQSDITIQTVNTRLESFEASTTTQFKTIDNHFTAIDDRFTAIDDRFDRLEKRFDHLEEFLGTSFQAIAEQFGNIDKRLDALEAGYQKQRQDIRRLMADKVGVKLDV